MKIRAPRLVAISNQYPIKINKMPPVIAILIFEGVVNIPQHNLFDLSQFNYFTRRNIKELITFFAGELITKTPISKRITIHHPSEKFFVHSYKRADGVGCVIVTDDILTGERAIYALINRIIDSYHDPIEFNKIINVAIKWDPLIHDPITKLRSDLDETTAIIHETIDEILGRGEKLDSLVAESAKLSTQSQLFYRSAAGQNKCCTIN